MTTDKHYQYGLLLILTLVFGFFSAYDQRVLLGVIGALAFIGLIAVARNEANVKRVLAPYLLIILFQDTITLNLAVYSPSLAAVSNYMDELFLVITLTALVINFGKGQPVKGIPLLLCMTVLLLFGSLSSVLNDVPALIAVQGAFLMLKGLLYFFIFMNLSFTTDDLKRYVKFGKVAASVVVGFALVDLAAGQAYRALLNITFYDHAARGGIESIVSLFIHPGIYGWFMAFTGMYMLAAFKVKKKKAYLAYALLFFLLGFLSFRFKVVLSVLVIAGVFYMLSGYKKVLTFLIPLGVLALLGFLVAGDFVIDLASSTVNSYVTADIYDSARKALYLVSAQIGIANFPFGEGFGRFGGFISREHYSPVYYEYGIHNVFGLSPEFSDFMTDTYWPNIVGETGFIGAAGLLLLFVYLVVKLVRNYKIEHNENVKLFTLFALFIFIQALVESLGEPVFNSAPQNVFIFTALGIAFSLKASAKEENREK